MLLHSSLPFLAMALSAGLQAQTAVLTCTPSAVPTTVRAEGVAERTGDIVFSCSGGQPGAPVSGNIILSLNTTVTNRILPDGSTDVTLTVNNGGVPVTYTARPFSSNGVAFNGVVFNTSPQGTAELRFANLRGNASKFGFATSNQPITASPSFTGAGMAVPNSNFIVAYLERAVYATSTGRLVCDQYGSPLPDIISVGSLLSTSAFSNTRVTEGFASAFVPLSDPASLRADSGTRIIVRYSGFTPAARLFVPDAIAGTDADVPTSAGDMGFPASGGQYTPGKRQLLLIRVAGADASGAGGHLAMPVPTAQMALNSASEVALSGGAGSVTYEVVDSNPSLRESAQLPVFLGLAPNSGASGGETGLAVNLAPLSNVVTQSTTAPIPRFADTPAPSDCTLLGDCSANYFPQLQMNTPSISFTVPAGQPSTTWVPIRNAGAGTLQWAATITPATASSWLKLYPAQGLNNSTLRVDAVTTGLAPGTYQASIVLDAGPLAGTRTIPVTLTVTPGQTSVPVPTVLSVSNAASGDETRLVAGSLATLMGSQLSGQIVAVTFDGTAADLLYTSATQINLRVPPALTGKQTSKMVVSVDGVSSAPMTVNLVDSAPAIFPGGVLDQDGAVNTAAAPAMTGSVLQIYATGLPASGVITAKIHDRPVPVPEYGGAAPGFPGVQQVNVRIPADLPAMQTWVYVCGGLTSSQQVCSAPFKVWIANP